MTDFTIIRRSLLARLFSTVTTIISVAVAVGLMLVLLSMRDAGRQAFERGSGNMELLISRDASPLVSVLNGVFYAGAPRRPIEWAKYEQIRDSLPLEFAVPTQQGDSFHAFPVLATTPEFFTQFRSDVQTPWALREGRFITGEYDVVLGAAAAKGTGVKVGDHIHLTHGMSGAAGSHEHDEFDFNVVGILEPTGSSHDRAVFTNLTAAWIIHADERRERDNPNGPKTTSADITEGDKLITGIYAKTISKPGSEASAVLPQVFDQLRRDPTITVASPRQEIAKLFTIVGSVDQIILALAAVVMVSSGIGIMLALYNSMEQRRRQIAVLRVLGCSKGRIFSLIMTESALLGAFGAAAGFVLFLAGAWIVAAVMKQRLGLVITPVLAADWTLAVIIGTVLLAAGAGVIPAVMAYRTSVARSLRPIG